MDIEAVLLTGGASRRMGRDKASLIVEGKPLAVRIAEGVAAAGIPVTVLGREPLPGYAFVRDADEHAGPLAALAQFTPSRQTLLVLSCDLPNFDPMVLPLLFERLQGEAVVIEYGGRAQPLCALYRAETLSTLRELVASGELRMMRWLDALNYDVVTEADLVAAGFAPDIAKNVNTPEDLGT